MYVLEKHLPDITTLVMNLAHWNSHNSLYALFQQFSVL